MISIVGAGGHGHDIASICAARGFPYQLVDDDRDGFPPVPEVPGKYLLGVNDPQVRAEMAPRFLDWSASAVVHPHVTRDLSSTIGFGCVIGPAAVLLYDCWLGEHVHVNYGVTMTRTTIRAFTTVAPGVTICGDVSIGERVFVGAGATIVNLVSIGDDAFIEAGARVTKDVPAGARVKGGKGERLSK